MSSHCPNRVIHTTTIPPPFPTPLAQTGSCTPCRLHVDTPCLSGFQFSSFKQASHDGAYLKEGGLLPAVGRQGCLLHWNWPRLGSPWSSLRGVSRWSPGAGTLVPSLCAACSTLSPTSAMVRPSVLPCTHMSLCMLLLLPGLLTFCVT